MSRDYVRRGFKDGGLRKRTRFILADQLQDLVLEIEEFDVETYFLFFRNSRNFIFIQN